MPNYQATYQSENLMTIRHYSADTVGEVIDKVMASEHSDWGGAVVYIELIHVRD